MTISEPLYRKPLPNYEVIPLRSDEVHVAAIQMKIVRVDGNHPEPQRKANLDRMLFFIDMAQRLERADLLVFPEYAMHGVHPRWNREQNLRVAIEMPGEETEALGRKAREYDCYIAASALTRQSTEWPGHFFNTSFIIDPRGKVILNHWKPYMVPMNVEFCTSVEEVLDEFVRRYGWDAVWPVARTDIGNLAAMTCSEGFAPESARAFCFKGAEILCRCISGGIDIIHMPGVGSPLLGQQAHSMVNHVYSIYANCSLLVDAEVDDIGCGHTTIFNEYGRVIGSTSISGETIVRADIPLGPYRKRHSIPAIRKALYLPSYDGYVEKTPPNLFTKYLPKDLPDAINYTRRMSEW